jgi:hypothetical protein
MTIFYCLIFETLPTWRARSPYLYPQGTGWSCYIPRHWVASLLILSESESHVTTDGQSASLSWNIAPILGLRQDFYYCQTVAGLFMWGALPDERRGSVVYNCCWPSPAQSFSGPSLVGLVTIFYCLRFETSLFVASYDSHDYGGGIRPRLHAGFFYYYCASSR